MRNHTAHRRANLTGVKINPPTHIILKRVKIRIIMYNRGRFAAKLQHAGHHILRRGAGDGDAGWHRSGKHDLVHIGMRRQGCACLCAKPAKDVHSAIWETHSFSGMGEPSVAERGEFRRFDHTGVARCQRRRERARCHFNRVIPRDDLRRDSERLVSGEVEIAFAKGNRAPFDRFRLIAVVLEIARGAFDLDLRFPKRLALFQGQNLRDLVYMVEQIAPHRLHHAAPLHGAQIRQSAGVMYAACSLHSAVHIGRIGKRMLCQLFARAGVEHIYAPRAAIDPSAVNVVLPIVFHESLIRC